MKNAIVKRLLELEKVVEALTYAVSEAPDTAGMFVARAAVDIDHAVATLERHVEALGVGTANPRIPVFGKPAR